MSKTHLEYSRGQRVEALSLPIQAGLLNSILVINLLSFRRNPMGDREISLGEQMLYLGSILGNACAQALLDVALKVPSNTGSEQYCMTRPSHEHSMQAKYYYWMWPPGPLSTAWDITQNKKDSKFPGSPPQKVIL